MLPSAQPSAATPKHQIAEPASVSAVYGRIGDASPTTALEDELRDFGADEVIVVTHPRDRETWQERGELERLRAELDVPVVHLVAGDGEE